LSSVGPVAIPISQGKASLLNTQLVHGLRTAELTISVQTKLISCLPSIRPGIICPSAFIADHIFHVTIVSSHRLRQDTACLSCPQNVDRQKGLLFAMWQKVLYPVASARKGSEKHSSPKATRTGLCRLRAQ